MPEAEFSVSLREYVDAQDKAVTDITNARLDGIDRAIKVALDANGVAISKSEQAIEYRLAGLNEFRQSLADQTGQLATKAELEALRATHEAEIKGLQKVVYAITGAIAVIQVLLQFIN
jgi:hypothetical protein